MYFRFWLTKQRCVKTLQHLPVTVSEQLPLLMKPNHPINQISKRRMFVTFHKHTNYIMVIMITFLNMEYFRLQ